MDALSLSSVLTVLQAPLVPGLGTLMMAYTAYQLTDSVFEGIVDWAEGRGVEAGEQALGVLEDVVQLGIFAAGANIAIISDRYGLTGPEGSGVMGVYVIGTMFGGIAFMLGMAVFFLRMFLTKMNEPPTADPAAEARAAHRNKMPSAH